MGRSRLDVQTLLEDTAGNTNVYFQPPSNVQMVYPCIVYQRDYATTRSADNIPYLYVQRYMVTVIDRDPDSPIHSRVAALPQCLYVRGYAVGGLNHDVFKLYF